MILLIYLLWSLQVRNFFRTPCGVGCPRDFAVGLCPVGEDLGIVWARTPRLSPDSVTTGSLRNQVSIIFHSFSLPSDRETEEWDFFISRLPSPYGRETGACRSDPRGGPPCSGDNEWGTSHQRAAVRRRCVASFSGVSTPAYPVLGPKW